MTYGVVDIWIIVFLTSALVGGEWSASRPGRLTPPGKERAVPIGWEAGWTSDPVWTTWRGEKSCFYWDSNFEPSAVQPVTSRYTDCATPAAYPQRHFILKILIDKHIKSQRRIFFFSFSFFSPFILFLCPYLHLSPSLLSAFRQIIHFLVFLLQMGGFRTWNCQMQTTTAWEHDMTYKHRSHTFVVINSFLLYI
jgi:hypothetical protein